MMMTRKAPFWILLACTLALSLSGCGLLDGADANAPQLQSVSFTLCASEVPEIRADGEGATCLDFAAEYGAEVLGVDTGD